MKYDWNTFDLSKRKRLLNKILKNDSLNINELEFLKEELSNINEMLSIMKNTNFKIKLSNDDYSIKYIDKNKLITESSYDRYSIIPPYLRKKLASSVSVFSKYKNNYDENQIPLPSIRRTSELIGICHDIYANLPTEDDIYLDTFLYMTNPNNHYLKIMDNTINTKDEIDSLIYGYTYYFRHPQYNPYILVYLEHTLMDANIINHEVAHTIFDREDINRSYYIGEVEGYKFEEITRNYFKNELGYDQIYFNELEHASFVRIFDGYVSFYIMDLVVNKYKTNPNIDLDNLIKYVNDKVSRYFKIDHLNESYLKYCLSNNNLFYIKYLVSYLVNLDLEKITLKDEELGFYNFEQVCKISGDNNIFHKLRKNNITFMDDGFKNLEKKIKKINNYTD